MNAIDREAKEYAESTCYNADNLVKSITSKDIIIWATDDFRQGAEWAIHRACQMARHMGYDDVAEQILKTLTEDSATDKEE